MQLLFGSNVPYMTFKWVSYQWLLLNTNWAKFQLYHGEKKVHFNDMIMMMSTLLY